MSSIIAPFGLLQAVYLVDYWHPKSILPFYGFDIESILYAFFLGGICAVAYEALFQKVTYQEHSSQIRVALCAVPLAVLSFFLLIHRGLPSMHATLFILIPSGAVLVAIRRDLWQEAFMTGILASLCTALTYGCISIVFPQALHTWFPEQTTSTVLLTEIAFSFCAGFFFGPLYNFVFGMSIKNNV